MAKVSLRYKGPRKTPFGGEIHGKSWSFDPSKKVSEGENLLKLSQTQADVLVSTAPDLWEPVGEPEDDSDETEQAQPVEQEWTVEAAPLEDSGYVFGADFGTGTDTTPDESTGTKKGKR